jgi:hypothetical protein
MTIMSYLVMCGGVAFCAVALAAIVACVLSEAAAEEGESDDIVRR